MAIITAIDIIYAAAINNSMDMQPNHSGRFFGQEILLLPLDICWFILPSMISREYLCSVMTRPKYYNFLLWMANISSREFCMRLSTCSFVHCSLQHIFIKRPCVHIPKASSFPMLDFLKVKSICREHKFRWQQKWIFNILVTYQRQIEKNEYGFPWNCSFRNV